MRILALDFETFFSKDYTLKKLTTEAYVRDPRFEALCLGFKWLDCYEGHCAARDDIATELSAIDWSQTGVLCHHAQFDGLTLSHHFGIRPAFWFDTLSMARMVHGNHVSASLDSLSRLYGLPAKSVPYDAFRGKHWADLDDATRKALAQGCLHDVDLTVDIFKRMLKGFPIEELKVIDQTVRMFTEPTLVGDAKAFRRVQGEEWTRKNETLLDLGVGVAELQSSARFVALLEAEGVEVERKATAAGVAPAIAKTDQFMKELLDDANPRVAALAAARLDVRSTIDETRAGRLAAMSERGPLCVYLAYGGAHTLRWSGGDKVNFQNFPREGGLREAIHAGPGRKLIVIDLSQIEARVLNHVAGQTDICEAFASGRDLYSEGASRFYKRPINKKENAIERHLGKTLELGCGYGMGWAKLQATCRAGALGGPSILLTDDEARAAVASYRESHRQVVDYWRTCDELLPRLAQKTTVTNLGSLGCYDGKLVGPNGSWMTYVLEWDAEQRSWMRKTRSGWRKIWGGGLAENSVQYLARIVMVQAALRIEERYGFRPVLSVHDELIWVVPEDRAGELYPLFLAEMKATPVWLPRAPIDAEGKIMECYGK